MSVHLPTQPLISHHNTHLYTWPCGLQRVHPEVCCFSAPHINIDIKRWNTRSTIALFPSVQYKINRVTKVHLKHILTSFRHTFNQKKWQLITHCHFKATHSDSIAIYFDFVFICHYPFSPYK